MTPEERAETLRGSVERFNGDINDPDELLREVAAVVRTAEEAVAVRERVRCAAVVREYLKELADLDGILLSDPPQVRVACPACGWAGARGPKWSNADE